MRSLPFVFAALALAACGDNNAKVTADAPKHIDSPVVVDTTVDSEPIDGAEVLTVDMAGAVGNDLSWNAATSTLYLGSYTGTSTAFTAKFQKYTSASGLQDVASTASSASQFQISGIAKVTDTTYMVASFGFNGSSGLYLVDTAAKTMTALTGVDASENRLGLATDATGNVYGSTFKKVGANQVGTVVKLVADADLGSVVETVVATQHDTTLFGKLVGTAADATYVYVSEQASATGATANTSAIYKVKISDRSVTTLVANLPCADLLTLLPDGSLLTSLAGKCPSAVNDIARIAADGTVTMLALPSIENVQGIAYDPAGHRLFVQEQPLAGNNLIRIYPYDAN